MDQFLPLFATNTAVVAAITHSLESANRTVSDDQRAHLLECVASLDLRQAPGPLADSILQLLDTPSTNVALAAVRAASSLGISGTQDALSAIARDPAKSLGLRLEAMREVVRQQPELDSAQMELLIDHLSKTNLPGVRLSVSEVLTSAKLSCAQIETLLKAVRSDPLISPASILDTVGRNGIQSDCAVALLDYVAASLDAGWTISAEQMAKVQAAIPEPHKGPRQTGWLHAFLRPWRASYRVNLAPKHREAEYKE